MNEAMTRITGVVQRLKSMRARHPRWKDWLLTFLFITILIEVAFGQIQITEDLTILDSTKQMTTSNIQCIAEDIYGDIIIGTVDGVYLFQPYTDEVNHLVNTSQLDGPPIVYDIATTWQYGGFFFLTHLDWGGLYWWWEPENRVDLINLTRWGGESSRLFNKLEASQEEPFLILGGGGPNLYLYNISAYNVTISVESDMFAGLRDMLCVGGEVLIAANTGFAIYNMATDEILEYPLYASEKPLQVNCLEYDSLSQMIYLGTDNGVYVFTRSNHDINLTATINEADGLAASDITCLELDLTTDRLYVGTKFGLSVVDLRTLLVTKNYFNLYPSSFQGIMDIYTYRVGRFHRIIVASNYGGIASLEVHNKPGLVEYTSQSYFALAPVVGFPTAILGLYLGADNKFTRRLFIFYILVLGMMICTLWIVHLIQIEAIPNVIPSLNG